MIHIILGTKAQLIKTAPVMVALRKLDLPYNFVSTGQHRETIDDILRNFDLPGPRLRLYEGPDVVSIWQMLRWSLTVLWRFLRNRKLILPGSDGDIVLVHGDTFSTFLGALMGKLAGLPVAHLESGLRSFRMFQPFPEELTRLVTFALSDYYLCPDEWAVKNLCRYNGTKLNTHGNTIHDALQHALRDTTDPDVNLPPCPFGVVTLHRFENFRSPKSALRIVQCVERIAQKKKILFVLHKITERSLARYGYLARLLDHPHIDVRSRFDYFTFVKILRAAEFVVSDGGSNQEECYYLGKPTLLLRNVSERQEGVGKNVLISELDPARVDLFIEQLGDFRRPPLQLVHSPAAIVASFCRDHALRAN